MNNGYLYIATGNKYINEVLVSASSLRRVNKDSNITLITDKPYKNELFDNIIIREITDFREKKTLLYKVKHIYNDSPYERTFFLDSDTYFYFNCDHLFNILDYYDICISNEDSDLSDIYVKNAVLRGCHPYSTGVILFKKNQENDKLFDIYFKRYMQELDKIESSVYKNNTNGNWILNEQRFFAEALTISNARPYVLKNNYQARTSTFFGLRGEVRIVHSRHQDYERLKQKINITSKDRIWDPFREKCYFYKSNLLTEILKFVSKRMPFKAKQCIRKMLGKT